MIQYLETFPEAGPRQSGVELQWIAKNLSENIDDIAQIGKDMGFGTPE
ncbi:MAG: hypothetical protein ACQESY_08630 [Pseudomonadota bacterium]